MRCYEKPELDAIEFNLQDVIQTSNGGLTNEGDHNDDDGDASDAEGELMKSPRPFFG